jgi:hypothetical protein
MTLQQIINQLQMNLPSIGLTEVFYYLNIAYKKIVTQDVTDFIFLNHDDNNFPFPILAAFAPAYSGSGDNWYDDWDNDLLTDKCYSIEDYVLYDTGKSTIPLEVDDVSVTCRRVANVFAFYNSSTFSDYQKTYKPFQLEDELYNKYSFCKIPFKSIDATSSSVAKIQFFTDLTTIDSPIFVEFYFVPPDITSVYSPCFLNLDKWGIDLVNGAKAYYQADINGREDSRMLFEQIVQTKISPNKNKSNSEVSMRFPTRI